MEKKLYTDDFEQFLKETADNFRMYPSKRVWNSLYNNLHPGRKWPSLAVCLLLVSSIVFIGLSHKNEITGSAGLAKKDASTSLIAYQKQEENIKQPEILHENPSSLKENITTQPGSNVPSKTNSATIITDKNLGVTIRKNKTHTNNIQPAIKDNEVAQNNTVQINSSVSNPGNKVSNSDQSVITTIENIAATFENETGNASLKKSVEIIPGNNKEKDAKQIGLISIKVPLLPIAKNNKSTQDKEWIEDYAFHNQAYPSLKSKLLYEVYVTPSIGYRKLTKNVNYSIPARSSITNASQNKPNTLEQNAALNLEAGYTVLYPYSKLVRIKAGFQLNYTNYISHAFNLGHSTSTTLVLNDPYSGGIELSPRSTTLANLPGESNQKLNNSTFQVSLPFGADMKIAGRHNFQWFVGATIQPTYVLFGHAYLVSSDMKNYVSDANFLRKWNINAGIETFVSYKTKKGITFNAGPQFRYQFFSTYNKKYSYDENLHNVGVKIGIVRNF